MNSSRRFRSAAFTLAEVIVAIGLFGITAAAAVAGLIRMNTNAALCRLQTGASTVAQNQIDLILSDAPFNPQYSQTPPELTLGTTSQGTSTAPTVAVYTDPMTNIQVLGWMTTVVTDTGSTLNGSTLYAYKATVTVSYFYKGRQYSVSMCTVRCADT
jgi:type II secretory pathway pseudopilin PulG